MNNNELINIEGIGITEKIERLLLLGTQRKGINELFNHMLENGFFSSPCSGSYHLAVPGGLAQHSLNVYETMVKLNESLDAGISQESIIIVSILHDLGKMGQYGKANYVPNMIKSKKKDEGMIQSESKPYETNKELLYVPHEIRSVQIASQFIELSESESFAILQHNGMYGDLKYSLQGKETPLQMLVHDADMWAARVIEV